MELVTSENYEEMGAEYQYQMIKALDYCLSKSGMDKAHRKEICGEFAFNFGMLHDSGAIEVEGSQYQPIVSFKSIENKMYIPNDEFCFHEYAYGNNDEAFD